MSQKKPFKLSLKSIALIATILTLIAEIVFAVQLLVLNMLPGVYSLLIILLLVLIPVLMVLSIRKGGKKPLRYIVILIMTVLVVAGCIIGSTALGKLQSTLNAITNQEEDSNIYVGVYVLKDSPAQSITDIKGDTFAYTGAEGTWDPKEAIQGVQLLLDSKITTKEYPSVLAVVDALRSGEVDAALINQAYTDLFEAVEGYEAFIDETRMIHEHAVKEQKMPEVTEPVISEPEETPTDPTEPEETEPPTVPSAPADEGKMTPFIMYISGSDTRAATLRPGRSDVNILVVVNPNTHQILLVNTPRDYYVTLGGKSSKDKLTHASVYGIDCSVKTMEKLYGYDISYYARINFNGFKKLIDAIGGITITSDVKFITDDDIWIYKGENHLNGEAALSFARERHHLKGGDNARGRNQMKVIAAVVDKVTSGTTIITKYADILDSLSGMFTTDMPMDKMTELVQFQLTEMPKWEIYSYAVTGYGASDYTYSIPSAKAYVMKPNQATVNHAKDLIGRIVSGEMLTDADMTTPKS